MESEATEVERRFIEQSPALTGLVNTLGPKAYEVYSATSTTSVNHIYITFSETGDEGRFILKKNARAIRREMRLNIEDMPIHRIHNGEEVKGYALIVPLRRNTSGKKNRGKYEATVIHIEMLKDGTRPIRFGA